tara:strand:- start:1761 stop:2132 length:372 start_codon:yes stop_codon:yes gene_type:complete
MLRPDLTKMAGDGFASRPAISLNVFCVNQWVPVSGILRIVLDCCTDILRTYFTRRQIRQQANLKEKTGAMMPVRLPVAAQTWYGRGLIFYYHESHENRLDLLLFQEEFSGSVGLFIYIESLVL